MLDGLRRRAAYAATCMRVAALVSAVGACSDAEPATVPGGGMGDSAGVLSAAPDMGVGRALHTVTRLQDGRLLVVGGGSPETPIASAELIDPAAGTRRAIPMGTARLGHTATLLATGEVLIVGGGYGAGSAAARSAELFDPATERFRGTGAPVEPRADHTAVRLDDGRVLVLGGDVSGVGRTPTASAELYDPATGTFARTGSMTVPRRPYGVVRLADGRVLVPGGTTTDQRIVASAELFTPAAGTFARTGGLRTAREKHTAALLEDGRVLVAGGSAGHADADRLATTELYDPAAGAFAPGPAMRAARHKVASARLGSGAVLVVGGGRGLAELYEPAANRFVPVRGAGGLERFYPAVVALDDGTAFLSGGYSGAGADRGAWRYHP